MDTYLLPEEDGLPMRSSGRWVNEKLDYLERYIDASQHATYKKWMTRRYIDLFAGPGKCKVDQPGAIYLGSPLLALTTRYSFTDFFFVDLDPESLDSLRKRCESSPLFGQIQFFNEDANTAVKKIVDSIRTTDRSRKASSLNLAFLDPQRLNLKWSTVVALASVPRMDLLIHYPQMGFKRTLDLASKQDEHQLDQFFGDKEWRKVYEKNNDPSIVERDLLIYYKGKLQKLGYTKVRQGEETGNEPPIRNTRRGILYRLVFASRDPLGDKLWSEVIRRDAYGQRRLF